MGEVCALMGITLVCTVYHSFSLGLWMPRWLVRNQAMPLRLPVSINLHKQTETPHWSTFLNLHHWVRKNLPGSFHDSGFTFFFFFGRFLLAKPGVNVLETMIRNLSLTLKDTAKCAAKAIAVQWKSLGTPAKLDLNNRTALDYLLAELGGVCAATNTPWRSWINTCEEAETQFNLAWEGDSCSEFFNLF